MTHRIAALAVLLLSSADVTGQVSPLDRFIKAPVPIEVTPPASRRSDAMGSRLAILSRLTRVPSGYEQALEAPGRVTGATGIDLRGKTVRQALDTLVAADPRYEWREVSGVVVVRSRAAWADCSHFLNRTVSFETHGTSVGSVVRPLLRLLDPSLPERPFREPVDTLDEAFSVSIQNGTVLDVLNAVAIHSQSFWAIKYGATESDGRWIELAIEAFGGQKTGWAGRLRPKPGDCQ